MISHPRLAHAIIALRPDARPLVDFRVQDDGAGPHLVEGSMIDPPSQEEVDAVTTEQLDRAQLLKNGWPKASSRQIRLALNALGLRDAVEVFVSAADQSTKDSWEYTTEFDRFHPFVLGCIAALGKTVEEADALFLLAITL